jgi:hypothetical protein
MAGEKKITRSCDGEAGHKYTFIKVDRQIVRVFWNTLKANVGDKVRLCADVDGFPGGAEAKFSVWEFDNDGKHDLIKDNITASVDKGFVYAEWVLEAAEDKDDEPPERDDREQVEGDPATDQFRFGVNLPEYMFKVEIDGVKAECTELLRYVGGPEFTDEDGQPLNNVNVCAVFSDGKIKSCKIIDGHLSDSTLWDKGNVSFHLDDDEVGGIG